MHKGGGRGEGDALVFLAGGQPQCQADVGFAGAGWPERDAVLSLLDPFAARQFENQRFVERRLRGEVKSVEALGLWKARRPDAALDVTPLAIDALQFAQTQQIARIIGAILGGFHRHLLILARECGKLQRLEVIAEQHLGRDGGQRRGVGGYGHAGTPTAFDTGRGLATRSR